MQQDYATIIADERSLVPVYKRLQADGAEIETVLASGFTMEMLANALGYSTGRMRRHITKLKQIGAIRPIEMHMGQADLIVSVIDDAKPVFTEFLIPLLHAAHESRQRTIKSGINYFQKSPTSSTNGSTGFDIGHYRDALRKSLGIYARNNGHVNLSTDKR